MAPGAPTKPAKSGWINIAIDYGPVLVFFIAYRLARPAGDAPIAEVAAVIKGTTAFMIATVVALCASKWLLGRISPMLWVTAVLVIGFGALTVYSQNPVWIRHKPTAVYLLFAVVLLAGWLRGKPTLKILLEAAFDGLSEHGWIVLSRNWGIFFLCLAGLNEVFANDAWFTFGAWLKAKLFVFLPLSFLFTFAHLPFLMKNGLSGEAKEQAVGDLPHE